MTDLSFEQVRAIFDYDPAAGIVVRKTRPREDFKNAQAWGAWNTKYAGRVITPSIDGYVRLKHNDETFRAHRLIWIWMTGRPAEKLIDHINGNPSDNSWSNLREVDKEGNGKNRKIASNIRYGVYGVRKMRSGRFGAFISRRHRDIPLGVFDNIEDAIAARKAAERRYGYHPNHGRAA